MQTAVALCSSDVESVIFAPVEIFARLGQKSGLPWVERLLGVYLTAEFADRRKNVM